MQVAAFSAAIQKSRSETESRIVDAIGKHLKSAPDRKGGGGRRKEAL